MSAAVVFAAIAWAAAAVLAWIWIRTWRRWRREQLADQQLQDELTMRRGFRALQRRKLLDREIHR